jgi:hypothetical protein
MRRLGKRPATVRLISSCHSHMIYSGELFDECQGILSETWRAVGYFCPFWLQIEEPRERMQGLVRQRTSRIAAEESKPHSA